MPLQEEVRRLLLLAPAAATVVTVRLPLRLHPAESAGVGAAGVDAEVPLPVPMRTLDPMRSLHRLRRTQAAVLAPATTVMTVTTSLRPAVW